MAHRAGSHTARARREALVLKTDPCDRRAVPWVHALLRGTKVLARVDERGAFVLDNGRVEIRYKPNDGRKYGARPDNLSEVSAVILPEETCAPAGAVTDAKTKAATAAEGSKSAGGDGSDAKTTGGDAPNGAATRPAKPRKASPKSVAASTVSADASDAHEQATATGSANVIHVYADGACSGNPGPAGLGVVVLDGDSRVELSEYIGHGTNNIAELTAILRALVETAASGRSLVIHTDSSYSIGVLQKGWKAKANQALIGELREVLRGRKGTRLVYVPGHAGVRWNERADALARDAVTSRKTTRNVVRSAPPAARA